MLLVSCHLALPFLRKPVWQYSEIITVLLGGLPWKFCTRHLKRQETEKKGSLIREATLLYKRSRWRQSYDITLGGGTSRILSTFCREQGTYHSAALLASFLAPEEEEREGIYWNVIQQPHGDQTKKKNKELCIMKQKSSFDTMFWTKGQWSKHFLQ